MYNIFKILATPLRYWVIRTESTPCLRVTLKYLLNHLSINSILIVVLENY